MRTVFDNPEFGKYLALGLITGSIGLILGWQYGQRKIEQEAKQSLMREAAVASQDSLRLRENLPFDTNLQMMINTRDFYKTNEGSNGVYSSDHLRYMYNLGRHDTLECLGFDLFKQDESNAVIEAAKMISESH